MKLPLGWLKDFVAVEISPREIARMLTMAGVEVKGIVSSERWPGVLIGRVVEVDPHPNADRLRLATVDLGGEIKTVVCGAPNLEVGQMVAFAKIGTKLIDGHTGEPFTLKPARIRGVVSDGMVCSEKELGLSDEHQGILVLPAEAPLGRPLDDHLGEIVLDLEVTPNRPDLLSIMGLAREVAVLTRRELKVPAPSYEEGEEPATEMIDVDILSPDLCVRYSAGLVLGVSVGESPGWLKERLLAVGMRPINNIVDITNYVMLEYGQPLHAFDYDLVEGRKIIIRRAQPAEVITTLDGIKRLLSPDMLVIADEAKAVAIAGVMGGVTTEISGATRNILLESANFNPASVHATASALHLSSEASTRFERGISPEMTVVSLRRAIELITGLAGGSPAAGIVDLYPGKKVLPVVYISRRKLAGVLGRALPDDEVLRVLRSLGFAADIEGDGFRVVSPYWRSDIRLDVDIAEEVARTIGYDEIPPRMIAAPVPPHVEQPMLQLKKKVGEVMSGLGFQEIITYSLVGREDNTDQLELLNPMSSEQDHLRSSLKKGLIDALALNRRHEEGPIRLFEIGRVFAPRPGELPCEREKLGIIIGGARTPRWWQGGGEEADFFFAKGIVETLLGEFGLEAEFEDGSDPTLRLGYRARIMLGKEDLGMLGELHPHIAEEQELKEKAYIIELDLGLMLPFTMRERPYRPILRYPEVARDLAIVVSQDIPYRRVLEVLEGVSLLKSVELFDVYTGSPVPEGKKSLACHLKFQSAEKTLTDDEVAKVLEMVLERLSRELGAALRG